MSGVYSGKIVELNPACNTWVYRADNVTMMSTTGVPAPLPVGTLVFTNDRVVSRMIPGGTLNTEQEAIIGAKLVHALDGVPTGQGQYNAQTAILPQTYQSQTYFCHAGPDGLFLS